MYRLYYAPGSAAMAPHAVLEEIGADYELVAVDISKDRPRDPAYLELNPNGWVPTLVDDDGVVHEAAAIVIYLTDRHPAAGLAPAPGDRDRGPFLKWLVYMADTLQIPFQMHYYPEHHTTDEADFPRIRAKAKERLNTVWGRIDAALDSGPYLLGERFSACDLYLHMLTTWTAHGDWRLGDFPNVARCAGLVAERPAVARMMEIHGDG